jgi:hypothetical protein
MMPGQHVRPGPCAFAVAAKYVGGQRVVIIHLEHGAGSTILPVAPEFAQELGDALIRASTGIEIARQ